MDLPTKYNNNNGSFISCVCSFSDQYLIKLKVLFTLARHKQSVALISYHRPQRKGLYVFTITFEKCFASGNDKENRYVEHDSSVRI